MAAMRIVCLLALAAVSAAALGTEIFKWVDDQGRTQYGQSVPDQYKKSAIKVDQEIATPTDAERQQATARAAKDKERAKAMAARKKAEPARPRTAAAASPASVTAADDRASQCEAQKQKYRESEACFAPYRRSTGTMRSEGFKHCVAMKEPTC